MQYVSPEIEKLSAKLKSKWQWFITIGVILIVLGCLALSYEFLATVVSIYLIGILLIIAGMTQAIHSFRIKSFSRSALWAVMGVLYIIAGIIAFKQPIETSTAVTLIFAFLLIVSGFTQTINAMSNKAFPRWHWLFFSGIITLILGIMILLEWPSNSSWVLGMFLGIDFIFQGWALLGVGLALKSSK